MVEERMKLYITSVEIIFYLSRRFIIPIVLLNRMPMQKHPSHKRCKIPPLPHQLSYVQHVEQATSAKFVLLFYRVN
jgi:hypothetical protein